VSLRNAKLSKEYASWKYQAVLEHGGHFAAMEYPELMAEDIRAFFHDLRTKK
jgi:hypothetical protein